jgi:mannose-6-phosphate isomerase-like protein (cupin superfamily)
MATETKVIPHTFAFSMKGNYLSAGRTNTDLARADSLWLSLKINAEGGENAVHAHTREVHSFVVLEGECSFFDEKGEETKVTQYEGIMIPKGAFYRYLNTGASNLVLLRIGAKIGEDAPMETTRLKPDGTPIPAYDTENMHVDGVPIPGQVWGAK